MASAIGDLVVRFGANTSGFMRGAGIMRRGLGGLRSAAGGLLKTFGVISAVGGAALAGAAAVVAKKMGEIDKIAKASDRIGIGTEALVGFAHGAEIAGLEQERFVKGLERMVRTIGEAHMGLSSARRGFEELGLSVGDLREMGAEKAFKEIADKIAGIEDPTKRAAAAYAIFGRQGQQMVNFLATGRAGVEAMQREAERLGITFSRDAAAGVEAANDAMNKMKKSLTGLAAQATIQIAPFIKMLADDLTGAIIDTKDEIGNTQTATNGLASEFGVLGAAIMNVADALQKANIKWKEYNLSVAEALANPLIDTALTLANPGMMSNMPTPKEWEDAAATLKQEIAGLKKEDSWSEDMKNRIREMRKEFAQQPKPPQTGMTDMMDELNKKDKARALAIQKQFETPQEKYQRTIDELTRLKDIGAIDENLFEQTKGRAFNDMQERMDSLVKQSKAAGLALTKQFETPHEKYMRVMDDYQNLLATGQISQETFDRASKSAMKDLEKSGYFGEAKQSRQTAGIAARGSRESYSAIVRNMAQMQGQKKKAPEVQTAKNTEKTKKDMGKLVDMFAQFLDQTKQAEELGIPS